MNLDNLILETTRRCNMKCGHCLRGEPENGCDWSYESQRTREDILICKADEDFKQAIIDYEFSEEEEY